MSSLEQLRKWAEQHRAAIREDYFHFLRFKSISADPAFAKDMKACAEWLRDYISKTTDMKAELIETEGYPLVYAENLSAGPNAPTCFGLWPLRCAARRPAQSLGKQVLLNRQNGTGKFTLGAPSMIKDKFFTPF